MCKGRETPCKDKPFEMKKFIRYVTPFAPDKNLAAAYNWEVKNANSEYIAFCDRDIYFPYPFFGQQIQQIIEKHGEAVYTCLTNRVNCDWQRIEYTGSDRDHAWMADQLATEKGIEVTDHTCSSLMSGFFIVFPVKFWRNLPEDGRLLGIDNKIHEMAKDVGLRVLLMNGVYVWHYYSGFDGSNGHSKRDKTHLL